MTSRRQQRVGEMLHQELSLLVGAELNNPILADAMVSVTEVEVSPDLRNALVLVEHSLAIAADQAVLSALRHAEGYLRQALAQNLELRFIPALSFRIDETEKRGRRVDEILDQIAAGDTPGATDAPNLAA